MASISVQTFRADPKWIILFLGIFIGCSDAFNLFKKFNELGDKVWRAVNDNVPDAINPLNLLYTNSCIEDLGCFYTGPPFFHPLQRPMSLLPSKRIHDIHFLLYTPNNPNSSYELEANWTSLRNSQFNASWETKILIHGFLADVDYNDIRHNMKDAILIHGNYNVIIVDWTRLNRPPYSQAAANTRVVGAKLAKLIDVILNNTHASPESFHITGHSLGGHVAGYAGERIANLGRITGLDPAGPYFHDSEPEVRLDPTDALFVDVIHTDSGEIMLTGLGTSSPIGHMDFYPNGGVLQPGCIFSSSQNNLIGAAKNFTAQYLNTGCDHYRASDYFLESINNTDCHFLAVQCRSYSDYEGGLCQPQNSTIAEMGFHNKRVPKLEHPAKFFLRTNGQSPYCNRYSIFI